MNDKQKAKLAMLIRACQHVLDHALNPANAKATEHFTAMAAARDGMLAAGGVKVLATGEFRMAVADRQTVIAELRRQMREIAETAKALNRVGEHPGLQMQFLMPKRTMQDLRDKAVAFKDAAAPLAAVFIEYDAAPTFIADLEGAIADFDAVTNRRYAGLGKQVGATASLNAIARNGIAATRALNAILIKRYRDNPGLLAEWRAAQRIAAWPSQATAPAPVTPPAEGGGSGI